MVVQQFASRESQRVAESIRGQLEAQDIQPLALISLSLAGGVVVAQEIADRVLPMLGQSRTPNSATGFGISAAVKFGMALLVGALASSLSGVGLVVAAFAAVGHLASAGADLFNAIQRTGFLAESQFQFDSTASQSGGSGNAHGPSRNYSRGGTSSVIA